MMLKFLKVLMPAVLVAGCGLKPSIDDEKLSNLDFSLVDFLSVKPWHMVNFRMFWEMSRVVSM